ncbi:LAGLIDADG family homing endonuclease [Cytobacillus sp. FJAT-53684]|uniref:LAGLIDADG family homing endonuclease n=1 Tax=Cytobacillus mangrovibacter TaxID=3299024 RepID=A0ABW6JUE6_9BACI
MESKERVNQRKHIRTYGARDKEELVNAIKLLHDQGYSQVEISKRLNIARGTIQRWNKELNIFVPLTPGEAGKKKNKKYHYDENYFSDISSPNQAYVLGYILGDGTIIDRKKSKRLILCLAENDVQLLRDIAEELNMSTAIKFRKKNAPNEQNKYSLTINSTKMCDDLISLGVGPKKTGHEAWIALKSNMLQWAFIRGFFDADGHIRVYQRNGYLKVRVGFTGSKEMLTSTLKFLQTYEIGLKVKGVLKKQGCYDLYLSSIIEAKMIFNLLYKHGDIKLNRKYEKFSSLMI